jgi:hypothetical protein
MRDTKIPESTCPWCGEKLDGAASLEDQTPKPGDITICVECLNVSKFDQDLHLLKIEEAEKETWTPEERSKVARIQLGLRIAHALIDGGGRKSRTSDA